MRELPPQGSTIRDIVFAINQLIRGRSNAVGEVTLRANETTTTVSKETFNANAQVFLFPKTDDAFAEVDTTKAAMTAADTFTITHANDASTDRTFAYLVIGG